MHSGFIRSEENVILCNLICARCLRWHKYQNIDQAIKFNVRDTRPDGAMPCLDTIITPEQNRIWSVSVYRKQTHRDQFLQCDSHHHIASKYSLINTLLHMAKRVCSMPELLRTEQQHLRKVLFRCKCPVWALDRMEHKNFTQNKTKPNNRINNAKDNNSTVPSKGATYSYLIYKACVRLSRTSMVSRMYKHILRKIGHSRTSW